MDIGSFLQFQHLPRASTTLVNQRDNIKDIYTPRARDMLLEAFKGAKHTN